MREIALFVEDHAIYFGDGNRSKPDRDPARHSLLKLKRPPAARYPDRASRAGSRRRGGSNSRSRM